MLLELQHIYFSFDETISLFNDLSLSVEKGKIYAMMGSNGAGKTTLFNLITGFIKPQSGEIFFGEKNQKTRGDSLNNFIQNFMRMEQLIIIWINFC